MVTVTPAHGLRTWRLALACFVLAAATGALIRFGVLLLLASLPPVTGVWPPAWGGPWTLRWAAWSSLAPPLAIVASVAVTRALRGGSATPPA